MSNKSGEPVTKSEQSRVKTTRATWLRPVFYVGAALIVLGLAGYFFQSNRPVIDRSITKDASFPVYVPKSSPAGYEINTEKTKLSSDTLTYTFSAKNDQKSDDIVVTVQPLPKNFSMQKLIGSGSVTTTNTDNGTLYDLSASQKSQYLLNTGDALIFFTSTSVIDTSAINHLASDLVKQD